MIHRRIHHSINGQRTNASVIDALNSVVSTANSIFSHIVTASSSRSARLDAGRLCDPSPSTISGGPRRGCGCAVHGGDTSAHPHSARRFGGDRVRRQAKASFSSSCVSVASVECVSCCANHRAGLSRLQSKAGAVHCPTVQSIAPQSTSSSPARSGPRKLRRIGPQQQACSRAWRNTGWPDTKSRRPESSRSFASWDETAHQFGIHEGPLSKDGEGMRVSGSERWCSLTHNAGRLCAQREETPHQPPAPLQRTAAQMLPSSQFKVREALHPSKGHVPTWSIDVGGAGVSRNHSRGDSAHQSANAKAMTADARITTGRQLSAAAGVASGPREAIPSEAA